jgi:hypothetical protein
MASSLPAADVGAAVSATEPLGGLGASAGPGYAPATEAPPPSAGDRFSSQSTWLPGGDAARGATWLGQPQTGGYAAMPTAASVASDVAGVAAVAPAEGGGTTSRARELLQTLKMQQVDKAQSATDASEAAAAAAAVNRLSVFLSARAAGRRRAAGWHR